MLCTICCEKYNKSNRLKVICPYCDFEACRHCCEQYILSESIPKCMQPECSKEWSRKFLRENFTNVFLTTKYEKHLENILFDQEKALLPATQPIIEEKIRKKNILTEIGNIDILISNLVSQKGSLYNELHTDKVGEKRTFVRQCPATGCRGFLSTQWKCGICELWTCPECHELKGPIRDCQHTCDPQNVETAKLLASDSKPCPTCQSLIFKIDGCDQMWCTQCHTAFNWRTYKIETNVHNPHFYEWQRLHGGGVAPRVAGDVECGRVLNQHVYRLIDHYMEDYLQKTKGDYEPILDDHIWLIDNIIRHNIHNMEVELPAFQTNYEDKNLQLRVKYLEGNISEQQFKTFIQRNDKKHRKNTEVAQIIQLSNTASTDIIYRILDYLKTLTIEDKIDLAPFIHEFGEIVQYCNAIFKDIAFTYKTVHYNFAESFRFHRVEKEF